jgi:MFS family permease
VLPLTRSGARRDRPPAWWPAGVYYGWALVGTLGLTATVSYGVLSYAFAVFIDPMMRELGWSKATVTGAFSLASLIMGLAAIPVGRWVDRWGAKGVMTAGSLLATLGLVAWSRVQSIAGFYAVWVVLGFAMAAVLYEPAFAVVATWFRAGRGRALTVLTFMGGFASVVFVPLATWLVAAHGWREAVPLAGGDLRSAHGPAACPDPAAPAGRPRPPARWRLALLPDGGGLRERPRAKRPAG